MTNDLHLGFIDIYCEFLPAAPAGGPRPLKVIAAEPAGYIDGLAAEVETGTILDFEAPE